MYTVKSRTTTVTGRAWQEPGETFTYTTFDVVNPAGAVVVSHDHKPEARRIARFYTDAAALGWTR